MIALGSAAAGGGGITFIFKSKKKKKVQRERERRAVLRLQDEGRKYTQCGQAVETAFSVVGKSKLRALPDLGKAATFLQNATLRDRNLNDAAPKWTQDINNWQIASNAGVEVLKGILGGGATGISTAAGVSGLVGIFGSASTGTAISTLSGVAASNATLAWLGGGSLAVGGGGIALGTTVIGGLVAGPAILAVGFSEAISAKQYERQVTEKCAKIETKIAEMRKDETIMQQVIIRANELRMSILKTRIALRQALNTSDPKSEEDQYRIYKIASSLASLIDTSLLD